MADLMSPEMIATMTTYPIAGMVMVLCVAVVHLYKRITQLEKEFRDFVMEQSAERTRMHDRTTRVLEKLNPVDGKMYVYKDDGHVDG